jgi:hypothetical protein
MKGNVQKKRNFLSLAKVKPTSIRSANLIYRPVLARKITYKVRFSLRPPGNTLTLYFIKLEGILIKDNRSYIKYFSTYKEWARVWLLTSKILFQCHGSPGGICSSYIKGRFCRFYPPNLLFTGAPSPVFKVSDRHDQLVRYHNLWSYTWLDRRMAL